MVNAHIHVALGRRFCVLSLMPVLPSHTQTITRIDGNDIQECAQRNPLGKQAGVLIMDGEHKLWDLGEDYLPSEVTEILDIIHASSYVWQAIQALHSSLSTSQYIPWVKPHVARLLQGNVKQVIRGFRWQAMHKKLTGEAMKNVSSACTYLENQAHRMRYDEYLATAL